MAEGGSNLKGSRSVEDMNSKKPGKLSAHLLNKFESDPALSRPESYPPANTTTHLSADDLVQRASSVGTKAKGHVRISFSPKEEISGPSMSSSAEEILSDGETAEGATHSKKKSRWKWHPFKKMKKLFSRKKHPHRTKSFEDIKANQYKPSASYQFEVEDTSLGTRTKSEPSLTGSAAAFSPQGPNADRLVQRTRSVPPRQNVLMQELKRKQLGSHEEVRKDPPMSPGDKETKAVSLPALNWNLVGSNYNGGFEGAVSFDSLPSASSLEGLQAAHDKIKVAPKHRRPPGRARSRTPSGKAVKEPPQKKPHKRSKTVPEALMGKKEEIPRTVAEANRHSGIVSRTIFESAETSEAEDGVTNQEEQQQSSSVSQPGTFEEKAAADEVRAQIEARASELLAQAEGPPKLSKGKPNSPENITVEDKPTDSGEVQTDRVFAGAKRDEKEEVITKEPQVTEQLEPPRDKEKLDVGPEEWGKVNERQGKEDEELNKENNGSHVTTGQNEDKINILLESKSNSSKASEVNPKSSETPKEQGTVATDPPPQTAPAVTKRAIKPAGTIDMPDWIMLAQKKTKRMSQMLETSETNGEEDSTGKTETSQKKTTTISGKMKKIEKPKSLPFKPVIMDKAPKPATTPAKSQLQRTTITRSYSESKPKSTEPNRSAGSQRSLRGFQCDKCIVCGTNVYQTERCSFDNSVLHRHCIKCTVCNRLLTIGNFVVAESKIYCKPHVGQVVPVSMG